MKLSAKKENEIRLVLKQKPVYSAFKDAKEEERYYNNLRLVLGSIDAKSLVFEFLLRNNHNKSTEGLIAYCTGTKETSRFFEHSKFDWREALEPLQALQNMFSDNGGNEHRPKIHIDSDKPIIIVNIADLHMGSWATDYELFKQVTEEIINTPNLYVCLNGDLLQMSIKLRGVLEVADNALPPRWQMYFLDSWLQDVHKKVLFSTWDNHSVMREENVTGYSIYAEIFKKYTKYSNGITHADIFVNDMEEPYRLAASHFFQGRSMFNPLHSHGRYMRHEGHDREIIMAGDSHVFGTMTMNQSGTKRAFLNSGTLQTNSGYAKRFFSLITHPEFPCIVLHHKEHRFQVFDSVKNAVDFTNIG
jgi:hypothetical protein